MKTWPSRRAERIARAIVIVLGALLLPALFYFATNGATP